jgi:hypothetical protein
MIILFTKALPIYLIRNESYVFSDAVYAFLVLLVVYLIYLQWIGTNVIEVYRETEKSLTEGRNDTPMYRWIEWISKAVLFQG